MTPDGADGDPRTPSPIYLDHNASTPVAARVFEAMKPYLTTAHGNPSSSHAMGRAMAAAVRAARSDVAALLGADADEIVFTSGGTESNNLAIKGVVEHSADKGRHLITSAIEHPAVLSPCRYLTRHGYDLTVVGVDGAGRVDPDEVAAAVRSDTVLISIMHANNEVGTIQPIAEIARVAKDAGAWFHTDAAQSCGKIPTPVDELGVDLLTLAGHKMYAPQGIGALYVRRGTALEPLHHGAGHERGIRSGTEPVANIVALGAAARWARETLADTSIARLRDRLYARIEAELGDGVRANGDAQCRLPNTLNVGFRGCTSHDLLERMPGVYASAGAACHAPGESRSAVLAAMGVPEAFALGAIRLSLGRETTEAQVDEAARGIIAAVRQTAKAS